MVRLTTSQDGKKIVVYGDSLMKKLFIILIAIGILLFLAALAIPIVAEISGSLFLGDFYGPQDDRYYIINFTTETGIVLFKVFGAGIAVCGASGFIFNKVIQKNCSYDTTVVAVLFSINGGISLFSIYIFVFGCHFFTEPKNHPILYPASITLIILSFLAFCGLMYVYIRMRKGNMKLTGILFDLLLSIIFVGGFFVISVMIYDTASDIFHYFDFKEAIIKIINAGIFIAPIVLMLSVLFVGCFKQKRVNI